MPELPEVETIVNDLKLKVLGRTFIDLWTDADGLIKRPKKFSDFKKGVAGEKIQSVRRRGKNIVFELSGGKAMLIHQKMTGHLLLGKWSKAAQGWKPEVFGPIADDPMNRFLHLIFWLDDGTMLALSDMRKFAKAELWGAKDLRESQETDLGPEPLEPEFSFEKFKDRLKDKKGKIKQVLMDQEAIAGIGNIYSDEILFQAKVAPFRSVSSLSDEELKEIYKAAKEILKKAIKARGASVSDFRDLQGEKGGFQKLAKVYRREGEKCPECSAIIKREKMGGRSAHFCPNCQI